jgi:hypothetical protein
VHRRLLLVGRGDDLSFLLDPSQTVETLPTAR